MKKILRYLVITLLAGCVFLGLAVAAFLYIPSVQNSVIRFGASQAGFELRSTDLSLGLSSFAATDLSIEGSGITFTAPSISVRYRLLDLLFRRTLSIESLAVTDFQLSVNPTPRTDLPLPPPPSETGSTTAPQGLFQPLPINLNIIAASANGEVFLPDRSRVVVDFDLRGLIAGHTGNATVSGTYFPATTTDDDPIREIGIETSLRIILAAANRIQKMDTNGSLRIETSPSVSPRPFAYTWEGSAEPAEGSERYTLTLSEAVPASEGRTEQPRADSPIVDLKVRFSPTIAAIEGSLDFSAPESILTLANARSGLTIERLALESTFAREKGREIDLVGRFGAALRPPVSPNLPIPSDPIVTEAAWDLAISSDEIILETLDATASMGGERLLVLELSDDIRLGLTDENLTLGQPGEVLARLEIPVLQLDRFNPFISGNRVTPFLDGTIAFALEVYARGDSLVISSPTPLSLAGVSLATADQVLFEDVNLTVGVDAEITRDTLRLNTSDGFLEAAGEGLASASASIVFPFRNASPPTASLQVMVDLDRLGTQPGISEQLRIGSGDLVLGIEMSGLNPLATSGSLLLRNLSPTAEAGSNVLGGEMRFNATGLSDGSGINGRASGKLRTGGVDSTFESSFTIANSPQAGPLIDIRIGDLFVDLESLQTFASTLVPEGLNDSPPAAPAPRAQTPPLRSGILANIPSDLGLQRFELAKGTIAINSTASVQTRILAEKWLPRQAATLEASVDLVGFPFIRPGESASATLELNRDAEDPSSFAGSVDLALPDTILPAPGKLTVSTSRVDSTERYLAEFRFQDQPDAFVSVDAVLNPESGALSGLARLVTAPRTTGDLLTSLLGGIDLQSDLGLTFQIDPDLAGLTSDLDLNATIKNLRVIDPALGKAIPTLQLASTLGLSLDPSSNIRIQNLSIDLGSDLAAPWLTATIPAPLTVNLNDLDDPIASLPANRSLLTLANSDIPLQTFRPLIPEGIDFDGIISAGVLDLRRSVGGLSLTAATPPGIRELSLRLDNQPLIEGLVLKLAPTIGIANTPAFDSAVEATLFIADRDGPIGETRLRTRIASDADGNISAPAEVFVESSIDLASLKRQAVLRDPLWNLETGTISINGTLETADPSKLKSNLRLEANNLRPMESLGRYDLTGILELEHASDSSRIKSDLTFRGADADSDLLLSGSFSSGDSVALPSLQLDAKGTFLDTDTLIGLASLFSGNPNLSKPDSTSAPATTTSVTTAPPKGPVWPALNASVSADIETLRYGRTRFGDVTANLALTPDAVAIDNAGFTYRDGKGTLEASTIFRNASYQLKLDGGISGIDVGALLTDLDPRGRATLSGIFDAAFSFESSSPDITTIADGLVGKATLDGRNGRIRALVAKPGLKALLTTGSIIGIATAGNNKRPGIVALSAAIPLLETIPFNQIGFELERTEDLTTNIPVVLITGPYLYVSGTGTIGAAPLSEIAGASLEMTLAPASRDPLNRHMRILGLTSGVQNEQGFERWRENDLRITGTVGSPESDQLWDLLGTALGNTLQKGSVDQTYNPQPDGEPSGDGRKRDEDPVINSILNVLENL